MVEVVVVVVVDIVVVVVVVVLLAAIVVLVLAEPGEVEVAILDDDVVVVTAAVVVCGIALVVVDVVPFPHASGGEHGTNGGDDVLAGLQSAWHICRVVPLAFCTH